MRKAIPNKASREDEARKVNKERKTRKDKLRRTQGTIRCSQTRKAIKGGLETQKSKQRKANRDRQAPPHPAGEKTFANEKSN